MGWVLGLGGVGKGLVCTGGKGDGVQMEWCFVVIIKVKQGRVYRVADLQRPTAGV